MLSPLTHEQDLELLELLHLGQDLLPDPQKALHLFWLRFGVADSYGCHIISQEQKPHPEVTNQTPSSPWLHPEILSIEVMSGKGQPRQSPTYCCDADQTLTAVRSQIQVSRQPAYGGPTPHKPREPPHHHHHHHRIPEGTRPDAFSRSTKHM